MDLTGRDIWKYRDLSFVIKGAVSVALPEKNHEKLYALFYNIEDHTTEKTWLQKGGRFSQGSEFLTH